MLTNLMFRFKYPFLLLTAEKERIVDNAGAKVFYAKTVSKIK
jgi:hypothetical protein